MAKTKAVKPKSRKPEAERQTCPVSFYCTQAQWDEMVETASRNGRKIAAEARFRCFPPSMEAK
jgi:hypothetical protein